MFWRRKASLSTPQGVAADRRQYPRIAPPGLMLINQESAGKTLPNAQIIDISAGGAAIRCQGRVDAGKRLVFATTDGLPPVLCEVIECLELDGGWYRLRCRSILGGGFKIPTD